MKIDRASRVRSALAEVRKERGLAAAELARRAGVSRQTIYAIENGSFVPNTAVALRLAAAVGAAVERLFSLDDESAGQQLAATLPAGSTRSSLVRLGRARGRLIAVPVLTEPAFLPTADGLITKRRGSQATVETLPDMAVENGALLIAGCDPALSILAQLLNAKGFEAICIPAASRRALEWLKSGHVHAAGSHLRDTATGDYNLPTLRRIFRGGEQPLTVTFASWEQGLVTASGNSRKLRSIADLASKGIRIINRKRGAGSRELLDNGLRAAGIPHNAIRGYDTIAPGHLAAAFAVAEGTADCCIASSAAARHYSLDFLPLAQERFDLTFAAWSMQLQAVRALLDQLNSSALRKRLQLFAGYDTSATGVHRN